MSRRRRHGNVHMSLAMAVLLSASVAGCLLDPCSPSDECGSASIDFTSLDPSKAGSVELTIRRQDLPSEQVTCRWQAAAIAADAGVATDHWICDPAPSYDDLSSVIYDDILVKKTTYELLLTGPAGMVVQPINQAKVTAGDACGCTVAHFRVPDSAWAQVGAK